MDELRIHLFGTPKIAHGRELLAIPRSQHRALLYRLAAAPEPVNREHLCFLFWADTDDASARRRLSQSLSHLRRALPDPHLLKVNKEHVCLDDLHWGDNATLGWLAYFGTRLRRYRLLVIATYRQEEPDAVVPLRHALYRAGVLSEMELAGLGTDAVHQLLHHADPTLADHHCLAQQLQQVTRGNSFFVLRRRCPTMIAHATINLCCGQCCIVEMAMDAYQKHDFMDYFQMLKVDGR